MEILFIIAAVVVAIIVIGILITTCYIKAIPTEAVVITGAGYKEPKFVSGKGVLVLPFIQRADRILMKIMKLDVKTPNTGVKTAEGVPLWIDSVVTVRVFSNNSNVTPDDLVGANTVNPGKPLTREEYIRQRQQAAVANFLGAKDTDFNDKVNDILQGNLREIVSEMTVMDVLTKRKEFASRVMDNAKPDLAKIGLEVVTFNIQDVQDAVDACGKKHGVVEAIGTQREMEITRDAERARADAARDIRIHRADTEREAAEREAEAATKRTEAETKKALREAELRAQQDRAQADARAAGLIREQEQEKIRRAAEYDVEIEAQAKEIEKAEKEAEVEQRRLDAEVRKKADAAKYNEQQKADAKRYADEQAAEAEKRRRQLDAEAKLFEVQREAEAKKIAAAAELASAQMRAQGIECEGAAKAAAIKAEALAIAEGIEKKAIAQAKMGDASKLEMMYNVLPEVAKALAGVLQGADNVNLYGGTDVASNLMGSMAQGLNQFMNAMADGTGADIDMNAMAGAMLGSKVASQLPAGKNPTTKPAAPKPNVPPKGNA